MDDNNTRKTMLFSETHVEKSDDHESETRSLPIIDSIVMTVMFCKSVIDWVVSGDFVVRSFGPLLMRNRNEFPSGLFWGSRPDMIYLTYVVLSGAGAGAALQLSQLNNRSRKAA